MVHILMLIIGSCFLCWENLALKFFPPSPFLYLEKYQIMWQKTQKFRSPTIFNGFLWSFYGLGVATSNNSNFRWFFQNFSRIRSPSRELLKRDQKFFKSYLICTRSLRDSRYFTVHTFSFDEICEAQLFQHFWRGALKLKSSRIGFTRDFPLKLPHFSITDTMHS